MKVRLLKLDPVDIERGYKVGDIFEVRKSMNRRYYIILNTNTHMLEAHQVELVEEEKTLPKSFACINTNQKLWNEYIAWLNKTYGTKWRGVEYKEYYGVKKNGECWLSSHVDKFDVILTLEEWYEIVNGNSKIENKMEITREQLKSIHDVACDGWKKKIEKYAERNPFGNTIEFTQEEINEMFSAATSSQVPILEGIFGKQQTELDFRNTGIEFKVDGIDVFGGRYASATSAFISLPDGFDEKNSFYLNPNYDWTLKDGVLSCFGK